MVRNSRRRRGFTLMEVLLVLAILVIMASFAVVAYGPIQRKANTSAAKIQIHAFEDALDHYRLNLGDYPTTAQGLDALLASPADLPNPEKWDKCLNANTIPLDPWGRLYQYAYPGKNNSEKPDIWSLGPDGADGTADDVNNWSQG